MKTGRSSDRLLKVMNVRASRIEKRKAHHQRRVSAWLLLISSQQGSSIRLVSLHTP